MVQRVSTGTSHALSNPVAPSARLRLFYLVLNLTPPGMNSECRPDSDIGMAQPADSLLG